MADRRHPPPRRRERAGTIASWALGAALASAAAAGPALAEAKVQRQLRERLGAGSGFAIDLDLGGLELRGLSRTLADERGRISAERVRIRPGLDGFVIEIEGLDGVLRRAKPRAARSAPSGPSEAPAGDGSPSADPLSELLIKLRGVPIEVVSHGSVAVELADDLTVTAHDLGLELPGDGRVLGRGRFEVGEEERRTSATLEFSAVDERPRELEVRGRVDLGTEMSALALAGRVSSKRASVELRERGGGSAQLDVERDAEPGRDRLTLKADALPLALLDPVAQPWIGRALADAAVELGAARLGGTIELVHGAGTTRARFDAVELSGLEIASKLLAPEPVEFASVHLDGEVGRARTQTGQRSFAQLTVEHRGVSMQVSGRLDPNGVELDVEVPTTECQALLDALPGTPPALAGTELRGSLDARFGFRLDYAELAQARARYLGEDAEALELEDFDAPGEVWFSLPYAERCAVARLGPGIDLAGLDGPYRHRFEVGSGVEKRRVLAIGDEGYVAISTVPRLALAFVILEDARFWDHDGFDREQIERAFWFNVLEGRVSRGASTISQQTARSLWLGIDRSLARKLGEALLAAELERELDKQRILEIYLNVIELGPEVHGVAEAARYHFGKEPRELTLIEALHLASMAPAPVAYARRFADGHVDEQWRAHLRQQVRRLRIRHLITAEQAREAARVHLRLRRHPELLDAKK